MKSYIVKRTTKSIKSLHRDKSLQRSQARASSIAQKSDEMSEMRSLKQSKNKAYSKSLTKAATSLPYQNFVKEMKIKLPTPKQKFYQFLRIPPFNRTQNHIDMINHFLKNIRFFKLHQPIIIQYCSRKVKLLQNQNEIDQKMMLVVLEGECYYQGKYYTSGSLINRKPINSQLLSLDPSCRLININAHQYRQFLSNYVHTQMAKFSQFISSIQTFKIFNDKILQKFAQNLTLNYYLKGQKLFTTGDEANFIYIVFSGKVSRKVIIQIQKINKIPAQKFTKILRILNKSYEHQIQFVREDIVGLGQVIDGSSCHKEQIEVEQDSIIIGIQTSIVEQNMDDYVKDRFKKYNLKKYPASYDDLCENYLKNKIQMRKTEQRKIFALQNELLNNQSIKRKQKIQSIIKLYQENVKNEENKHLLERKLLQKTITNK